MTIFLFLLGGKAGSLSCGRASPRRAPPLPSRPDLHAGGPGPGQPAGPGRPNGTGTTEEEGLNQKNAGSPAKFLSAKKNGLGFPCRAYSHRTALRKHLSRKSLRHDRSERQTITDIKEQLFSEKRFHKKALSGFMFIFFPRESPSNT